MSNIKSFFHRLRRFIQDGSTTARPNPISMFQMNCESALDRNNTWVFESLINEIETHENENENKIDKIWKKRFFFLIYLQKYLLWEIDCEWVRFCAHQFIFNVNNRITIHQTKESICFWMICLFLNQIYLVFFYSSKSLIAVIFS